MRPDTLRKCQRIAYLWRRMGYEVTPSQAARQLRAVAAAGGLSFESAYWTEESLMVEEVRRHDLVEAEKRKDCGE